MIRFSLECSHGHCFESWFQSNAAFDRLCAAGQVTCPVCDDTRVRKALMAPAVAKGKAAGRPAGDTDAPQPMAAPMAAANPQLEAKLRALRAHLEAHSSYVGKDFARQARQMHLGEVPEAPIHGEARIDEARALIEDGVPVAPLPFLPTRKTN
ncbi:MAG: DUF1178 family protein [Rhodobacteraceae bacterium]|nr:DUF1178 family protein [Paracoccaceae bacterium]